MNSKKGQKAKLRERYFIETGLYPLDNLNRYNHWLEDEIVNNINYTRCYVSEAVQLFCSTCGSKDLCASCMRMPIETIQDKIKNNCT